MKKTWLSVISLLVGTMTIICHSACTNTGTGTIKIGWIGVLSGENAVAGEMIKRGTDLAVEEINVAGGIAGRKLEVIYQDDQLDPKTGVSAFEKLTTVDQVPVVIQAIGSSVMLAEAPIAERQRVVLISPTCTSDQISLAGDYVFRIAPRDSDQGEALAQIALERFKSKTSACLYINNAYGEGLKSNYVDSFERGGGSVAVSEGFNPGTTDFRAQLIKIRNTEVPVTALISHHQEGATALRQAKELGVSMQFIGPDGMFVPRLIQIAGTASEGLIVTTFGWNKQAPAAKLFAEKFQSRYGAEPDVFAAYGFDCLKVIAKAIETGGATADGIKQALYSMKDFDGVTGRTTFDSNGDVKKAFAIYVVEKGEFRELPQ